MSCNLTQEPVKGLKGNGQPGTILYSSSSLKGYALEGLFPKYQSGPVKTTIMPLANLEESSSCEAL